jgi:hypothetical protein
MQADVIRCAHVTCAIDRDRGVANITVSGPVAPPPADVAAVHAQGCDLWPLALARELDDLILHLRANEESVGLWVLRTTGSAKLVEAYDRFLADQEGHRLVREIRLYLKRTLKRLEVSSRSMFALIEPGSCFAGTLLELALAADRSYMFAGTRSEDTAPPATIRLTALNFGAYPMVNGLTRLASRFLAEPGRVDDLKGRIGHDLDATAADEAGLVTFTPDDIDWEDEVRLAIEERAAFSPDALTGMEASLRFGGPETLESRIFGRCRHGRTGSSSAPTRWVPKARSTSTAPVNGANSIAGERDGPDRLPGANPQQRQPGLQPPPATGAGGVAAAVPRVVAGDGPERLPGERSLFAHGRQRGPPRLGPVRLRADARVSLGHLPGRTEAVPVFPPGTAPSRPFLPRSDIRRP